MVMTKNLETADNIVKLVLSVSTIVLFSVGVIAGPFAEWLVVLSFFIVGIAVAKFLALRFKHRKS
jgi:hypothetical protein